MTPENAKELIETSGSLDSTYLGYQESKLGFIDHVTVKNSNRPLHTMVTGPTGTGKTNFLQTVFLQDARKTGAAFLNPKGSATDELLAKLPEDRLDDVIYINPGEDRCPGINLLKPDIPEAMSEAGREMQRKIVVSNLMALFRRLSDEIGERWPRNLRSLLTAHVGLNVHHGESNTLLDVYRCVEETERLVDLLNRVEDPVTRKQLEELKGLGTRERQPLLRRLSDLLENQVIRRIITPPDSSISFSDALANQEIILVDAQGGNVGDWAARIIGGVALTQLWSAAAARNTVPEEERHQFHIHVDEIQEYVSEADHLRRMLSQCREFNVSLAVATQYLDDLDTTLRRAILNNTMIKVVFSPGASEDLATYKRIMNGLTDAELTRIGKYRPAVQRPAEQSLPDAEIINTYPPWAHDRELAQERKAEILDRQPVLQESGSGLEASTGDSGASGGEDHEELLRQAKQYLEFEEDVRVNILHQDGTERPDGHVIGDEEVVHLEAEHTTLSHPEKVLKNLGRAREQDRDCIFIVQESNVDRLQSILDEVDSDHYRVLALSDLGVIEP